MKIIKDLKSTKLQALDYFDLDERYHLLTYEEGKWNVKQLLHHIADAETVLYERIRRIRAEPKQVIWGFDQDLWATNLDYNDIPLHLNKHIFGSVRDMIILLAEKHYTNLGGKTFIHNETGLRTLKDEIDKVVWHCEHHLMQVEKAINK